ncbi:rna-directed dna polymerase from mobile element jockey-like [Willisornis vidua]|uniref:Rna-directed dna polymerase from mobile element jockey-like n=1 Tax=Willisornis vidua TaxID=1566151 RepID=A0ABQ9CXN8_9PASS|nr:rna-directed dna polymerase from mobile element jockey-like [Willisornis vidua]
MWQCCCRSPIGRSIRNREAKEETHGMALVVIWCPASVNPPHEHNRENVKQVMEITLISSGSGSVTLLMDEEKALDVVYMDLSKAFDTISHSIVMEKLQPMAWTGALSAGLRAG